MSPAISSRSASEIAAMPGPAVPVGLCGSECSNRRHWIDLSFGHRHCVQPEGLPLPRFIPGPPGTAVRGTDHEFRCFGVMAVQWIIAALRDYGTNGCRGMRKRVREIPAGFSVWAGWVVCAGLDSPGGFRAEWCRAAPPTPDAGAHADSHTHLEIITSPEDQLRDLTVSLPPGLPENPQSKANCTADQLNADSRPAGSQIGTTTVNLTVTSMLVPLTVNGSVYNVARGR